MDSFYHELTSGGGWTAIGTAADLRSVQIDPRTASRDTAAIEVLRADSAPDANTLGVGLLMGGEWLIGRDLDNLGAGATLYARALLRYVRLIVAEEAAE
ncbi:hypothetical protein [Thiococcus pfennigii]|uniref:hypothetical protein n=1 Tax=Thiococcus pfennigii TaxID=1057 RepID=UPI00190791C7|nr:hypothetical protein [Thiococcus pfennigii]MBK1699749.1 hypothetical protein [Thiococcus pfennigii]